MKVVTIIFGVLLCLVLGIFLLQVVASETHEVVVLTTASPDGPRDTRLWVVEHEGAQYLRADAASGWYQRLVAEPRVAMQRDDVSADYLAVARVEHAIVVNDLMRDKYGWRDVIIEWLVGGRDDAIAVRLEPAG